MKASVKGFQLFGEPGNSYMEGKRERNYNSKKKALKISVDFPLKFFIIEI